MAAFRNYGSRTRLVRRAYFINCITLHPNSTPLRCLGVRYNSVWAVFRQNCEPFWYSAYLNLSSFMRFTADLSDFLCRTFQQCTGLLPIYRDGLPYCFPDVCCYFVGHTIRVPDFPLLQRLVIAYAVL